VNAVLENEDINKLEQNSSQYDHSWDEGHFSGDRDGTGMNLQPLGTSNAPTRGPSPAPSLNVPQPNNRNDEDTDLERALQASREDLGRAPQQDTGVLMHDGTEVKQFGPATKDYYDSKSWAMVPSNRATAAQNDDIPDPDAAQRIHLAGEPRFLKHSPDGDYTPNLITICHAIPAAREAFLMRYLTRPDYGKNEDWWRGHAIGLPRIVHVTDGSLAEPSLDNDDELIAETQRLTAFLDDSTRSYADIGGLRQTQAMSTTTSISSVDWRSGTLLERFLTGWTKAAVAKASDATVASSASKLFTTTVDTTSPEGMDTPHLTLIDMNVTSAEGQKVDLSELLDGLIWETDPGETEVADNFLESTAEVLVMRLRAMPDSKSQLGVEVPAFFHVDKYLKDNVAATREIRQNMALAKRRMNKIGQLETDLKYWSSPHNNTKLEAKSLLQHSLGHFSGQNRRDADKLDTTNTRSLEADVPEVYADVAAKLESVMASIDRKLELLALEKEKTRQVLADYSKSSAMFGESGGKHRYTLRGVATKPNITYVLRRKDEDPPLPARPGTSSDSQPVIRVEEKALEDFDEEDTTPRDHQWWRIDYEVSTAVALQPPPRITISKAPDYDVIRAVELEHNSALLVYASEAASSPLASSAAPLPDPLLDFITRDNNLFKAELDVESGGGSSAAQKRVKYDDRGSVYQFPLPAYEEGAAQPSIESAAHDRLGWSWATPQRRDSMDSMTMHTDTTAIGDTDGAGGYSLSQQSQQPFPHEGRYAGFPPAYGGSGSFEADGKRSGGDTAAAAAATAATQQVARVAHSPEQHHGFGLGYDISSTSSASTAAGAANAATTMHDGMILSEGGHDRRVVESEVAEIKLSPELKAAEAPGDDGGGSETGGDGDVEMREDGK
jgi:hypothetical protein